MTTTTQAETQEITFPVTGMTCASCVRRIEKALARVEGVEQASVNLATEKATVAYDPGRATPAQMKAAVERVGYGVREQQLAAIQPQTPVEAASEPEDPLEVERQRELDDLKHKWTISLGVGLAMMALSF